MKSNYDIIKRPIITEKSSGLVDKLQYTFEVAVDANKDYKDMKAIKLLTKKQL